MNDSARGLVVVVGGPDGAGKSTLAEGIVREIAQDVPVVAHSHWRPDVLPHPRAFLRQEPSFDTANPHARRPHGSAMSVCLLGYYWLDFLVGGWFRFRGIRGRGGVVVVERGWSDIGVDSRRYRLTVSPRLVRLLGRFLPRPDLALVLGGEPAVLHARKPELPPLEVARQNEGWKKASAGRKQIYLDGSERLDAVLGRALAAVRKELAARNGSGPGWTTLPGASQASASYPVFDEEASTAEPRWWVPRASRRTAREALLLYHPATTKGLLAWEAARSLAQCGGFRLRRRCANPPGELVSVVETRLREILVRAGVRPVEPTSFAAAKCNQEGKFVVSVHGADGSPVALAKVAVREQARIGLAREAANLEQLGRLLPDPLRAPEIVGQEDGVLVLAPARWRPRLRPVRMPLDVASALGGFFRAGIHENDPLFGPAHGDATPWNLLRTDAGWMLIDWEHAMEAAPPFHDLFHFFVHPYSLMGRPSAQEILAGLRGHGWIGAAIEAYANAAAIPVTSAPELLVNYLEASLDTTREIIDSTESGLPQLKARRLLLAEMST